MNSRTTKFIGVVSLLGVLLLSGFIPRTVSRTHAAQGVASVPLRVTRHGPPYKIVLSNSYIGNTWRVEMVNEFKAACQMAPYKSLITCDNFNATNSVPAQTQQMNNIISSRPDAIIINAASTTGLNGVINQACQAGILVVSFDAVVTAPCALKVNTNQINFGRTLAQFVAQQLHGKGNVIMVTGIAGTSVDTDRNTGADQVFGANPGIKVVARYSGNWDSGVAQRNTAAQLPSLGRVDGVWAQGGTDGIIRALINAHRPFPIPVAGEAENGFRQYMLRYKSMGFKALSIGQPPYLVLVSLELAVEVLQGKHAKADVTIPFPSVTTDTVREGLTTFKDLPDNYFVDFTDSGPNATVVICADAPRYGKPCPGALKVRLPS